MKGRKRVIIICTALFISLLCLLPASFSVLADDIPALESVSFENAKLVEEFRADVYDYTITLDDETVTPMLESYELSGQADVFVTYETDYSNRQTGLNVELRYSNGSVIYTFEYKNIPPLRESSDNTLSAIYCPDCQLEPEINSSDTSYRLYIPKDLTKLVITPVTNDTNAYCPQIELTLNESQEPVIPIVCIATDGSRREYKLKVRRVDKTIAEIRADRENGVDVSLSDGEKIYQQPVFFFLCSIGVAGVLTIIILSKTTKKVSAVTCNSSEKPFYKQKNQ